MLYEKNKSADQPARPRSLFSTYAQHLYYSLSGEYKNLIQAFSSIASLCSGADLFKTYCVESPENRYYRKWDVARSSIKLKPTEKGELFR